MSRRLGRHGGCRQELLPSRNERRLPVSGVTAWPEWREVPDVQIGINGDKYELNRYIRSDELLIFPLHRTASEAYRSATPMSALSEASTPAHDAASAMDAQQLHQPFHQHPTDPQQQQQHTSNGPSPVNDSTATRKGDLLAITLNDPLYLFNLQQKHLQ